MIDSKKSPMPSIKDYSELIKQIPVEKQSAAIKGSVWNNRFENVSGINGILKRIFGTEAYKDSSVELSRKDVRDEEDTKTKIVKALMWGYPSGGRGKNIENILININELSEKLSQIKETDLEESDANKLINGFESIRGLGISTWTKFLYFFDVSIESKKCQIYDLKIVDSLNKAQFRELDGPKWKQDNNHYYKYIEKMDNLAATLGVSPDKVELFLFYFNLYYKF